MAQRSIYKSSQGIALISVLLVFTILAWVVSYFLSQTNAHLNLMENIKNKVKAEIEVDSLIDEVYFTHLTSGYIDKSGFEQWNYRGQPFSPLQGLTITIQDTQGKLNLGGLDKGMLSRFLDQQGVEAPQIRHFLDCIEDWQDGDSLKRMNGGEEDWYIQNEMLPPRNGKMQTVGELEAVCGFPKQQRDILYDNLILSGDGGFSPLFASKELIMASTLVDDRKETLIALREQQGDKKISEVYNQNSSQIGAYQYNISDVIEIKLEYKVGQVLTKRNVVISHRLGYNPRPIIQYWHWSE